MKEFLAVISLLLSGAIAEPAAAYAPSGWRPSGPSFDLPQRGTPQPQNPRYLPPLDPRNNPPSTDEDVSVQGLPQPEQRPLFQVSPISGQQYTGPAFNQDLRDLDEKFQQSEYQRQQERYREYQRQKQLESQPSSPAVPSNPRQFARTTSTTEATTSKDNSLNQGEVLEPEKTQKTTVEVTKQNLKEYPGELFLSSLAQLQLQPQFLPLQTVSNQYIQPSGAYIQPEKQGYDGPAHFSALPSVLAQQRQNELLVQNEQPLLVQQPISQFAQAQIQTYQPQIPSQQGPVVLQAPAQFQPNVYLQPNPEAVAVRQNQPQFIAQPVAFPPQQPAAFAPQQPNFQQAEDTESIDVQSQNQQNQDQQFYQQPSAPFQPQNQYNQPQFQQPGQQTQFAQPGQPQYQFAQSGQPETQFVQPGQPQTQFSQPGQPQTQFSQPGQPQTQFSQPGQPQTQFSQPGQPQTQFLQPGQPQTQFLQPGQPQTQFVQPGQQQTQFLQPQNQIAQPEIQYQQPQYNEPQNQYGQPQLAQPEAQFVQQQFAQPQAQFGQPQAQFGQQFLQPQSADLQNQFLQPQQSQNQQAGIQNQYLQPQRQVQPQFQGQDNLQSGLDVNQQGNGIEEPEDDQNDGATAVATAFGSRTQPRVNTRYGAPYPVTKVQATTESAVEEVTEDGPAVAQAVAVANGERRKNARLRSRRIRPVYALDRSGQFVLAEA